MNSQSQDMLNDSQYGKIVEKVTEHGHYSNIDCNSRTIDTSNYLQITDNHLLTPTSVKPRFDNLRQKIKNLEKDGGGLK